MPFNYQEIQTAHSNMSLSYFTSMDGKINVKGIGFKGTVRDLQSLLHQVSFLINHVINQ